MRIIFKILAAPFVVVLTVSWALMVFLFCWAEMILNYVSGLAGLIALVLFFTGQTTGGIVFAVIAFLISPVGIPAIAKWLIDLLDGLNDALKCFITT
jgi:hypothetical protein